MRSPIAVLACLLTCAAAPAHAAVPHVVGPGETLWSIAAANNFTTRALAVYNGLGVDSQGVLGSTIEIPSVPEAAARLATAPMAPAGNAAPAPAGARVRASAADGRVHRAAGTHAERAGPPQPRLARRDGGHERARSKRPA